jgi:hypothetical protein
MAIPSLRASLAIYPTPSDIRNDFLRYPSLFAL